MDEHAVRRILEGGGGGPGMMVRACLWLPGQAYGAAMRLRRSWYRQGWLSSFRALAPTISIGNLTAGGSGKTPLTVMLARELSARGRRPAILLRGYHSQDGQSDEAVLYRRLCPNAIVEADRDRRAGAERALTAGADILLMDDGFQHLRLRRDMDIVLVDATAPWGGGNTIPGGLLREPKSALRAADAVILTRSDQVDDARRLEIRSEIKRLAPRALVLSARHRPERLMRLDGTSLLLQHLSGRRVVALSGIARPEAFQRTLQELGAVVVASLSGRDHDHFSREFLARARETARAEGAVLVTTEKDRAKKIFTELTDNISVDNNSVVEEFWILGIEQELEDREALLSRVGEISSLHFG